MKKMFFWFLTFALWVAACAPVVNFAPTAQAVSSPIPLTMTLRPTETPFITDTPQVTATPEFPYMELSTDLEHPGTCTYEDITSGRLAYWERQNAQAFPPGTKPAAWINEGSKTSDLLLAPDSLNSIKLASICKMNAGFEGFPKQEVYVIGIQVLNQDGTNGFIHVFTYDNEVLAMTPKRIINDIASGKGVEIVRQISTSSVNTYWNDKNLGPFFRLYKTEGAKQVAQSIEDLKASRIVSPQIEMTLLLTTGKKLQ